MVVILRCLSSSSSSSVSFIIQRRDDEKRERERESICINTKERRENSFKVWLISCCCFKQTLADEFCLNFFFERICSHKQQQNNNTNTHIEQSLFVVIAYILRAKAIKINHV